jgi:hypothetical protein
MSLPEPINWLRGSRESTGEIYLVRMIDTVPTGSLSGLKNFYEENDFLEEFTVGIFTADKIEQVRNDILTLMLEKNPALNASERHPTRHLVWFLEERNPDYWELRFIPLGHQSGKSFGNWMEDYFTVATISPWRINNSHLGDKPIQL